MTTHHDEQDRPVELQVIGVTYFSHSHGANEAHD